MKDSKDEMLGIAVDTDDDDVKAGVAAEDS